MKKWLVAVLAISLSGAALANDITGKWRTIDDATKKPKAVVQITESGGIYSGSIISLYDGVDPNCGNCTGAQKGKKLVGQKVLSGLRKASGDDWPYQNGSIVDPKNGKKYSAKAKLINGGQSLQVRGYVGISMAGRTQTWQRVE